jgi:DNA-binding MarR family transcriptional regulator
VLAVNEWLAIRGNQDGPLFPRILKGGHVTAKQISNVYVNLLIKRLADAAGLDTRAVSGRSLRTAIAGATTFSRVASRLRGAPELAASPDAIDALRQSARPSGKPGAAGTWESDAEGIGPISFDTSARWETRLGMMIDELSRLQSAVVSERMKHLGITRIQYIALSEISNSPGLPQSDLARRLNLTKEGVSGLVSRLAAGGWVFRRSDPGDSRVRLLYLTDKSSELMRELRHIVEEVTVATFRNIAEDTGHDLLRVLAGMKTVLLAISSSGVVI